MHDPRFLLSFLFNPQGLIIHTFPLAWQWKHSMVLNAFLTTCFSLAFINPLKRHTLLDQTLSKGHNTWRSKTFGMSIQCILQTTGAW
ncbi:hypothetical protein AAZX31_05G131800 [Glycine max]